MNATVILKKIKDNMEQVMVGKGESIDLVLIALICSGHVLIEDLPGLGKTTLASSLSRSLSCSFKRIQFTPDVLPSDITGFSMYRMESGVKEFHEGSIMSQIVLADEINRTNPKTQSALLEAMQENQVSVDGITYKLPRPFMVMATQNPIELTGTYPLPEAQLDRFLMQISLGYPTHKQELQILMKHHETLGTDKLLPVASAAEVIAIQDSLASIYCSPLILKYIVTIAERTRNHKDIAVGVSPRGSIALMKTAMGCAMMKGRDFVLPDDVQKMLMPTLAHRILMNPSATMQRISPQDLLISFIKSIPVPAAS